MALDKDKKDSEGNKYPSFNFARIGKDKEYFILSKSYFMLAEKNLGKTKELEELQLELGDDVVEYLQGLCELYEVSLDGLVNGILWNYVVEKKLEEKSNES